MKKLLKAALSAALALLMALCVLPVFALSGDESAHGAAVEPYWTVPDGYNAHDYNKCAAFLEQTDENGVKNGDKLGEGYDVNDPATWGDSQCFQWATHEGERCIVQIQLFRFNDLVGILDVSDCRRLMTLDILSNHISELNVSGCASLLYLDCAENRLSGRLDVSDCVELIYLYCDTNALTELDVSTLTKLEELDCYDNELTALDVSSCPLLEALYCTHNPLTALDLSGNPILGGELIKAEGNGFIGYNFLIANGEVHAFPAEGASFEGFYDGNGNLLDEGWLDNDVGGYVYYIDGNTEGSIVARFSGGSQNLAGDIDDNGIVNIVDATLALRIAMQIMDADDLNTDNGDMDGDGRITIADAVTILRIAMGLA